MNRSHSAAALSRRQLLHALGGLVGATLGMRAVSAHAAAQGHFTRPKEALASALQIFQPYELPLPNYPQLDDVAQRSERVNADR